MASRSSRTRLVLLALAVSLFTVGSSAGCGDRQLRKISAPRDGVQLRYALDPETAYTGKVDVGVTRQVDGSDAPIRQAISAEVTMAVLGETPDGGTRVRITLTRGDLDWGMLPDSSYSRDAFLKLAVKRLKGLHLPMTIGPTGGIVERPALPADIPAELAEVIDAVTDALATSFVVLPPRKVSRGDRWSAASAGRVEARFKGLFRHLDREEDVADLALELRKVPIGRDGAGERQGNTRALFATAGYPAHVDLESRDFDPVNGMALRRVQVEWKKAGKALPLLQIVPEEAEDEQVITDPCNPDYVGPATCQELEVLQDGEDDDDDDDDDDDADTD